MWTMCISPNRVTRQARPVITRLRIIKLSEYDTVELEFMVDEKKFIPHNNTERVDRGLRG